MGRIHWIISFKRGKCCHTGNTRLGTVEGCNKDFFNHSWRSESFPEKVTLNPVVKDK